jgi:hypothetical protein
MIHTETDRQQGDIISLLLFFRNKESRLKTKQTEEIHLKCAQIYKYQIMKHSASSWRKKWALVYVPHLNL